MAAAPTCKIAVINLQKVIKDYVKFQNVQKEMKDKSEFYRQQVDALNAKAKSLQAEGEKPTATADQREVLGRQIKDLQRQVQDKTEEANGAMQKLHFDRMVTTYKEVQDAVGAYARVRGIELVMHYQDGIDSEQWTPTFFSRRLTNTACQPIYMAPGVDVTVPVTQMLNAKVTANSGVVPGVPVAPR